MVRRLRQASAEPKPIAGDPTAVIRRPRPSRLSPAKPRLAEIQDKVDNRAAQRWAAVTPTGENNSGGGVGTLPEVGSLHDHVRDGPALAISTAGRSPAIQRDFYGIVEEPTDADSVVSGHPYRFFKGDPDPADWVVAQVSTWWLRWSLYVRRDSVRWVDAVPAKSRITAPAGDQPAATLVTEAKPGPTEEPERQPAGKGTMEPPGDLKSELSDDVVADITSEVKAEAETPSADTTEASGEGKTEAAGDVAGEVKAEAETPSADTTEASGEGKTEAATEATTEGAGEEKATAEATSDEEATAAAEAVPEPVLTKPKPVAPPPLVLPDVLVLGGPSGALQPSLATAQYTIDADLGTFTGAHPDYADIATQVRNVATLALEYHARRAMAGATKPTELDSAATDTVDTFAGILTTGGVGRLISHHDAFRRDHVAHDAALTALRDAAKGTMTESLGRSRKRLAHIANIDAKERDREEALPPDKKIEWTPADLGKLKDGLSSPANTFEQEAKALVERETWYATVDTRNAWMAGKEDKKAADLALSRTRGDLPRAEAVYTDVYAPLAANEAKITAITNAAFEDDAVTMRASFSDAAWPAFIQEIATTPERMRFAFDRRTALGATAEPHKVVVLWEANPAVVTSANVAEDILGLPLTGGNTKTAIKLAGLVGAPALPDLTTLTAIGHAGTFTVKELEELAPLGGDLTTSRDLIAIGVTLSQCTTFNAKAGATAAEVAGRWTTLKANVADVEKRRQIVTSLAIAADATKTQWDTLVANFAPLNDRDTINPKTVAALLRSGLLKPVRGSIYDTGSGKGVTWTFECAGGGRLKPEWHIHFMRDKGAIKVSFASWKYKSAKKSLGSDIRTEDKTPNVIAKALQALPGTWVEPKI